MTPQRPLQSIAVLLLAAGAIAAACGGGDGSELTLEEYFAQAQAIYDNIVSRGEALRETYDATPTSTEGASDEERVRIWREQLEGIRSLQEDFFESLRELNPPDDVSQAHDAYVDTGSDVAERIAEFTSSEAFEEYIIGLEAAESLDEIKQLQDDFLDPDVSVANERHEEACTELETIATENGMSLDLGCG